jgi:coenzyme Q-binding protein COQ10
MSIGYRMISEVFTTRVVLDRGGEGAPPRILVSYVDGPFRHLENRWTFLPADGPGPAPREPASPSPAGASPVGCRVQFYIDYEFRSRMLGLLMGTMFDTAFRRFAEAFERRADLVYSRRALASRTPPTPSPGA